MKNSVFLIIAVLLAASCTKDNDKGAVNKRDIAFSASEVREAAWAPVQLTGTPGGQTDTQTKAQTIELEGVEAVGENVELSVNCEPFVTATKGTPVTSWTGSLGLYGYNYTGAWGSSATPNLAANVELTKNASDDFYQSAIMWPLTGNTRFYAYAPYNVATATPANSITAGVPELEYTVPDNIATQHDLLWASRGDATWADRPDTVGFTFHHALTAIQFKISSNSTSGVIKKITLKGIVKKGVFNLDTKNWTPSSDTDDKGDFVIDLATGINATANTVLADGANTLLMIPQSFASTSNAVIEFSYYETNTPTVERKLTASLKNATWAKGTKMVYQLKIGSVTDEPVLEVTLDTASEAVKNRISWDGTGSLTFKVKSYRQMTGGGSATPYQAVPWTAEVKVGGAVVNATVIFDKVLSGNGSATGGEETVTVMVKKATPEVSITAAPGDAFLTAQPQLGTSTNYYNLPNQTNGGAAIQNTANCYMIHAPGYYSFPLVYGNAIKNGSTNSSAYTSTATGQYVLTTFKNHLGNNITGPYINNCGETPKSAAIVWQDQPQLVSDITLDMAANSGNGAIKFVVNQATIKQGNAIIAVKNSNGVIMWSWHIWVTHYIPKAANAASSILGSADIPVKNYSNVTYNMMPYNLGWCDVNASTTITSYPERAITITFKQSTGQGSVASNVTITGIKQSAYNETKKCTDYNPSYQWGRKDPMLPMNGSGDNAYYTTGTAAVTNVFVKTGAQTTIATTIKNPQIMYANSTATWCSTVYDNLWSANNTVRTANDNAVVKTIYDPCPVGYCVPASAAFTGFSTSGAVWNAGYTFNTGLGNTIYIPAAGYRNNSDGGASNVGGSGHYWTAVPHGDASGWFLSFGSGFVDPQYGGSRSYGFSVRPVREK